MGEPSLCYAVIKIKMMKGKALKKHMKIAASVLLKLFMSGNEIYLFFFEKSAKIPFNIKLQSIDRYFFYDLLMDYYCVEYL